MKDENNMANEPNGSEDISEAAAEAAFGQDATAADKAVADRMSDAVVAPSKAATDAAEQDNKGAQGDVPPAKGEEKATDGGLKKPDTKAGGSEDEAKKARQEAEDTAKAQQEAEQRALLAAEAEKNRQAQADAAKAAAAAPLDAATMSEAVREAIKGVKIEGYDNFEAFEKEYGKGLTEAITAISASIARNMVAPIIQERQAEIRDKAHDEFVGKVSELGHSDIRQIEADAKFWGWLDKPENASLKLLVEKADLKGTDLVLRTYKAENGISMQAKAEKPPEPAKSERQKIVDAQRDAQRRSDSVHTMTGRRQASVPGSKEGDEDIKDFEDAEKAFNEESARVQEKARGATIR